MFKPFIFSLDVFLCFIFFLFEIFFWDKKKTKKKNKYQQKITRNNQFRPLRFIIIIYFSCKIKNIYLKKKEMKKSLFGSLNFVLNT